MLYCVVSNSKVSGFLYAHWVKYSNGQSIEVSDKYVLTGETTTHVIHYQLITGGFYSCQYNKFMQFDLYAFNMTVEVEGMVIHVILMFNYSILNLGTEHTCINPTTTTSSTTTTTTTTSTTTSKTITIHTTSSTNVDVRSTSSINPHFKGQ